ncbi:MAG TPA: hypothetical protein VHD62_10890 [Opitutaceae bacterium]|nr:hypothetical protein [Opitutaceae bacterium]
MTLIPATRRRVRRPQLEKETPLVAIAAARRVLEEASLFLGTPLPSRYAFRLAARAAVAFAQSDTFRRGFRHRADGGRERLYVYLRHWLADLLCGEAPALFAQLPRDFCTGAPLPEPLSVEARQLAGW